MALLLEQEARRAYTHYTVFLSLHVFGESFRKVLAFRKLISMTGKTAGNGMTDKTKILVIEDEPGVSMMMVYLLTQAGCEVQTAWNAERGLKLAQTRGFDLIALDINLPGISGSEIYGRLKENPFFQTPIVFMSGQFCENDIQHGLELGAADFIEKPFEATDFIFRILSCAKRKDDFNTVTATEETAV